MSKVLFVVPFAHYAGHFPTAAITETDFLTKVGIEVRLLTFAGVRGGTPCVEQITVPPGWLTSKIAKSYEPHKHKLRQLFMSFIEYFATILTAFCISKRCEVIYIRDGDPHLSVQHLLGLFTRKTVIVSVIMASAQWRNKLYSALWPVLNSCIWRPIFTSLA